MLVLLIVFLIAIYGIYDDAQAYIGADDTSLIYYKPGYEDEEVPENKQITGNMVGWVTVINSKIDYPIMQGKDNSEYLN